MFSVLSFGSKSLRFVVNALARFCKSIFDGVVFPDSNSTILLVGISVLFEISSNERLEISLKYFISADVAFSVVEKSRANSCPRLESVDNSCWCRQLFYYHMSMLKLNQVVLHHF